MGNCGRADITIFLHVYAGLTVFIINYFNWLFTHQVFITYTVPSIDTVNLSVLLLVLPAVHSVRTPCQTRTQSQHCPLKFSILILYVWRELIPCGNNWPCLLWFVGSEKNPGNNLDLLHQRSMWEALFAMYKQIKDCNDVPLSDMMVCERLYV